jgi:hypothetical protein
MVRILFASIRVGDFRIVGALKGSKTRDVQRIQPFGFGLPSGDEMQEVIDSPPLDASPGAFRDGAHMENGIVNEGREKRRSTDCRPACNGR